MSIFRRLSKAGIETVTSLIEFDGAGVRHMKPTQAYAKYLELTIEDLKSVSETHVALPEFTVVGHGKEPFGFTIIAQFNPKLLPGALVLEAKAGDTLDIPSSLTKFKVDRLRGIDYVLRLYMLDL